MATVRPGEHEFQLPADFAFFEGGPLRPLWIKLRARLHAAKLEERGPWASIIGCIAVTWAPILVLSLFHGDAWSRARVPFVRDIEAHARLLVALPLLLVGSRLTDRVLPKILGSFVEKEIIFDEERPKFDSIVASLTRWNRSRALLAILIAFVLVMGRLVWREELENRPASWYGNPAEGIFRATPAGSWYALVSIPLFQFVLYRWYLRLILWWVALARIARLKLRLLATNPDHAGGLGFLGNRVYAFIPFLFAQGAMVFGVLSDHIFNEGRHLESYYPQLAIYAVMMVILILGPMTSFMIPLVVAKRQGKSEFGRLATRYVEDFSGKWIHPNGPVDEPLLGTNDIQSLADLANSHKVVDDMRAFPFNRLTLLKVVLAFLLPVSPLVFTVFPFKMILQEAVKMLL